MSDQPVLTDLFAPDVRPVRESWKVPHAPGSHASWTGAQSQVDCWTEKQSALLQLLANSSPLTRNEMAVLLRWPLSSVCSVFASVRDRVTFVDFETVQWNGKSTKRERWTIR